jgi:hypothetical protein
VALQVTVFTEPGDAYEGPIRPGPRLYEWAKSVISMACSGSPPDQVRREAAPLGPGTRPSRAFYSHHLAWVLDELVRTPPANVSSIRPHHYRFTYGVPTKTVHWATAAGIRPGADSVFLGDADVIA